MAEPVTREDLYMAAAAGESVQLPTPITRRELFLAKAAGMDVVTPEPITREEAFLANIHPGSGGGTASNGTLNALIDRSIESISSDAVAIGDSAFERCLMLKIVDFPNATSIGASAFYMCENLENVKFPAVTDFTGTYAFYQCKNLKVADFSVLGSIYSYAFYNCTALDTLILRNTSVCTLSGSTALGYTPLGAGGTGGTVYVPQALIESYQTASNWSALYEGGTCNFVAIEGSEYE